MKAITFKFFIINILASIALFITYRIVIAETNHADENFFKWVVQVLDILLNLAYSIGYILVLVFCSCVLLLNLIAKIRNNRYLSLFTFIGVPLFCVTFLAVAILADGLLYSSTVTVFRNLLIFSVMYLIIAAIEFFLFRKAIKKISAQQARLAKPLPVFN